MQDTRKVDDIEMWIDHHLAHAVRINQAKPPSEVNKDEDA
jgi:hypothetical protein